MSFQALSINSACDFAPSDEAAASKTSVASSSPSILRCMTRTWLPPNPQVHDLFQASMGRRMVSLASAPYSSRYWRRVTNSMRPSLANPRYLPGAER